MLFVKKKIHHLINLFFLPNIIFMPSMQDQAVEGARIAGASMIIGIDFNPKKYQEGNHQIIIFHSSNY